MRSAQTRWEMTTLFLLGGVGYLALELAWRGMTHWSMFWAGGGCLCLLQALARGPVPARAPAASAVPAGAAASAAPGAAPAEAAASAVPAGAAVLAALGAAPAEAAASAAPAGDGIQSEKIPPGPPAHAGDPGGSLVCPVFRRAYFWP